MTDTAELEQRRRDVRCLELIDASHRAWGRGLRRATHRLAEAAAGVAPDTYVFVMGGIMIGEVPGPERDPAGWADYLDGQRDELARLEQEAG